MDLADDLHEKGGTRGQQCGTLAGNLEVWQFVWQFVLGRRRMTAVSHARDVDVQQERRWRSWWWTLLYVDASASTLLSLSVGGDVKGMPRDIRMISLCVYVCRSWRCNWAPCCFRLVDNHRSISRPPSFLQQSLLALAHCSNKRRPRSTVPFAAGAAPFRNLP